MSLEKPSYPKDLLKAKCQVFWMYGATWLCSFIELLKNFRPSGPQPICFCSTSPFPTSWLQRWFLARACEGSGSAQHSIQCKPVCFSTGSNLPLIDSHHYDFPSSPDQPQCKTLTFFMCFSSLRTPVLTSKLDWSNPFVLSVLSIWHLLKSFLYVKCICHICLST